MLETVSLKQHNYPVVPAYGGVAPSWEAPALQAEVPEFDSPHLHQGTKEDEQLECRYVKHNGRIAQVVRAHA